MMMMMVPDTSPFPLFSTQSLSFSLSLSLIFSLVALLHISLLRFFAAQQPRPTYPLSLSSHQPHQPPFSHPKMLSLSSTSATTTAGIHHLPQQQHQPPQQSFFLSPPPPLRHRKSLSVRCSATPNGGGNHPVSGGDIFDGAAVSAAISSDYGSINREKVKLKIGIIGFGNFGQFLAKAMVREGHTVLAYSRSNYSRAAQEIGARYFSDADDLCEEHPEVILLCTSILSTERVLRSLPLHRLRRSTLFADVLSVKEFPRSLFMQLLPPDFDILCTHPMFGPDSGKAGWGGLPFVFDKVRVGSSPTRENRVEAFLDVFRNSGCRMVEMSCAEHDKHAAGSQFITHMMGRVLEKLDLENTPINTKGYESLLNLVDNTTRDSFELFYGLFLYNKNAMEQLDRMDWAFEMVKKQLSGYLHDLVRKQLMLETNTEVVNGKNNNVDKKLMLPLPGISSAKIMTPPEHNKQHDLVVVNGNRQR